MEPLPTAVAKLRLMVVSADAITQGEKMKNQYYNQIFTMIATDQSPISSLVT